MAKSRQKTDTTPKYYCRKCQETKASYHFYKATDMFLDSNNLMSICKECVLDIYDSFFLTEHTIEKTLLRMCRLLNVQYDEKAIESAKQHIKTSAESGTDIDNIFGLYKSKLIAIQKTQIGSKDVSEDLTFVEPSLNVIESFPIDIILDKEYYKNSWGKGKLDIEDYEYLESEFAKWKETTKCNTQGEEVLVREICHKQNEIRKARIEGKSTSNLVKQLQEIMKNSNLTPALQNAADANRFKDRYGSWIKDIENLTPAEWWEDQEKYKDMDNMAEDKKDIIRSIKNFITGSRDFNTVELESIGMMLDTEEGE